MQTHSRTVFLLFAVVFLLTQCRTDPKPEDIGVDFKRTSNEVIIATTSEADNLNPQLTTSGYAQAALNYMFQSLINIDPSTSSLVPVLAEARPTMEEIEEDGEVVNVTYTFNIRDEAVWANGTPVTAADVVFTMKAILNPRVPAGAVRSVMTSIKDVITYEDDPKKLTIVTQGKYIRNEEVAGASFFVMPAYHYDPNGLLNAVSVSDMLNPETAASIADSDPKLQQFADEFVKPLYAREVGGVIGSGPYELGEFTTGQRLVLNRKSDWWGEGLADNMFFDNEVAAIVYQPIADANAGITAVRDEQIDILDNIAPEPYNELKADAQVSTIYNAFEAPRPVTGFWLINTKDPKLKDKRVRRAIAHVVNVDEIIETVLNSPMKRTTTTVLEGMPGYDDSLKPIQLDIDEAKSLLAAAGWEDTNGNGVVDKNINGEQVEMDLEILVVGAVPTQQAAALLVQEDAIQAGINLEVVALEPNTQRQRVKDRDYELATSATFEPTPWAYDPFQMWHTTSDNPSGFNRVGFGNAESDALIEEIQTTLNQNERNKLYKRFQRLIYEEQPMVFLYQIPNFMLIHKRFDAEVYPILPNYFPASLELKEELQND